MAANFVPKGFHTVTPYLIVEDVDQLLDFLEKAFDGQVSERIVSEDGSAGHAQVRIGDSFLMMGRSSEGFPPLPCMIHLYVEDADASYEKALKAGAEPVMAVENQYYGDRAGGVRGPQGNYWWVATHIEDVSREELQKRAAEKDKNKR